MKPLMTGRAAGILLAGVCLCVLVSWLGYRSRHSEPAVTTGEPAQEASVNSASPTPATGAAAKPEPELVQTWEFLPLPLAPALIPAENDMWLNNGDYKQVPRGVQTFGGIEFLLEGMIQMQGTGSEGAGREYRKHVILPLVEAGVERARIGSIHLLCGTRFNGEPMSEVSAVVWKYADGGRRETPIIYLQQVREWNRPAYDEPARLPYPHTKVVWRAKEFSQIGNRLRLYRLSLANPAPERRVSGIELTSGKSRATLFIVAVTLDTLAPGARDDNSPDLEPEDPAPPKILDAWVQTHNGQPVPGARLTAETIFRAKSGQSTIRHFVTDSSGAARIGYFPGPIERLDVSVAHDQHAGRKMVWDVQNGDAIPGSYLFKLGESVTIGGVTVDEENIGIGGATVKLNRFWTGGDEMNRKGDQPSIATQSVMTDGAGIWSARGLPAELLDRISLEISHPDYLSTNLTVGGGQWEKALREGTARMTLYRGLPLSGLVLDEHDNALPGASVFTSKRFYRDRAETKTDQAGRFVFPKLRGGSILVSVMADGFAPESRSVEVRTQAPEVVFRLKPGSMIRGVVQDEAAHPISGASVVLEGNQFNDDSEGLQFEATTKADGRFEWKGAPNTPKQFYIGKAGYLQVRNRELKPKEENIVTLAKEQKIEGVVLDADTGRPVTKFKVGIGRKFNEGQFYPDYPGMKERSDMNGKFELTRSEYETKAVRVTAEDYTQQTQEIPSADTGVVRMEFRMQPGKAVRGIVVSARGEPLPGVTVALVRAGNVMTPVTLERGKLRSYTTGPGIVTTDNEGRFVLESPEEPHLVFAAGAAGTGTATMEELATTGRVVLEPYGAVEGVLRIAGAPAAGYKILFSLRSRGVTTDFQSYQVMTDEQGRFSFTQVPAGEGELVRLVPVGDRSWRHSHETKVTVESGKTTQVTLGESGGVVRGKVRMLYQAEEGQELRIVGTLVSSAPSDPAGTPRAVRSYSFVVNADGSFMADSLPPGDYHLSIDVSKIQPHPTPFDRTLARGDARVTVPENVSPSQPIDIGEVTVMPQPQAPPAAAGDGAAVVRPVLRQINPAPRSATQTPAETR